MLPQPPVPDIPTDSLKSGMTSMLKMDYPKWNQHFLHCSSRFQDIWVMQRGIWANSMDFGSRLGFRHRERSCSKTTKTWAGSSFSKLMNFQGFGKKGM